MKLFFSQLLIYVIISVNSLGDIHLGFMTPQFTTSGYLDTIGIQYLAAIVMATNEINSKNDSITGGLLPSNKIKLAYHSPKRDFIVAVTAALGLARDVFGGNGVVGVIGPVADDACESSAQVFAHTTRKIPQISYGCTVSALGHKDVYPYFIRTNPSDAYEGQVLARMIGDYFHWRSVVVFTSDDSYGNDIRWEFDKESQKVGLSVDAYFSFWPGTKDLTSVINSAFNAASPLKIFVLLLKAADAGNLIERGYEMGLFKEGTQILGTHYVLSTSTWSSFSDNTPVDRAMKGVIAVSPTIDRTSVKYQSFVTRWRSQRSTISYTAQGMPVCNNATDDDGGTYLYQGHANGLPSSPLNCSGQIFSNYAADGSDIDRLALYAYDATYAMAMGLHVLIYDMGKSTFSGDDLLNVLVQNVSFMGVSGYVAFNNGSGGQAAYGKGDRYSGLLYSVLNFNSQNYLSSDRGASAIQTVGVWSSDTKRFQPCTSGTGCAGFVFNTADNSVPSSSAAIEEVQLADSVRLAFIVVSAFVLVCSLLFGAVVVIYRQNKIVKASQPNMLFVILLGSVLGCLRVIVGTLDITDMTCIAGKWLGHMSFCLFFGAMILKTWRVEVVVNSGFRRNTMTMATLQKYMGFGVLMLCVYLAVATAIGQPHRSYEEYFKDHTTYRDIKCDEKVPLITYILFAMEAVLLGWGAALCWSTKNVPDAVNDAKYIAMCKCLEFIFTYYYSSNSLSNLQASI